MELPRWFSGKELACPCRRHGFNPWVGKISWRRAWQPFIVLLPGESPWTEEPGGLQPMGSQRVGRLKRLHTQHAHTHTHTCTHAPGPRYCSSWIFEGPRSSQTQPSGSAAVLSLPSAVPACQRGHSECRESRPLPRSFHCSQTCPS